MRPDESKCIICGKEIDEWGGFATLVCYDEAYSEEYGESIELFLEGDTYICKECWENIVKNVDKIKKLLKNVEEEAKEELTEEELWKLVEEAMRLRGIKEARKFSSPEEALKWLISSKKGAEENDPRLPNSLL